MGINDMHFTAPNLGQTSLRFGYDYVMLKFGEDTCVKCNSGDIAYEAVLRTLGDNVNVVILIEGECCSERMLRQIQILGGTIIASSKAYNLAGYSDGIRFYDPETMQSFPEKFEKLLAKARSRPAASLTS